MVSLSAKFSSPPATRSNGLMATWSIAMPMPMTKRDTNAILYVG
jgi:hypothetical protein